MFNKCSNCGTRTIGGRRDGEQIFCSQECQSWFNAPGYCEACMNATSDKSLGGTWTINAVGTKLYGLLCREKKCAVCGSVPQRMWFVVIFIPVFPVSREYRVKYTSPSQYISRQVVREGVAAVTTHPVDAAGGRKCPQCGTIYADAKACPICAGRAASASG